MSSESERITLAPAQKASLKDVPRVLKGAVQLRIDTINSCNYENDRWPLERFEEILVAINTLMPWNIKESIRRVSSYNYGRWILDCVFPKAENPDDFHSTEGEICLTDNPIQVLGWQDKDQLVEEGVRQGLIKDWIDRGFEVRASERGLDLEWHFFEVPSQSDEVLQLK